MRDGIQYGRCCRDQDVFAQSLGAVRSMRIRFLDEQGLDRRDVPDGGDEIVMEVFGFPGEVFFHERHTKALGDAAVHLALGQERVDGLADIMGCRDVQRAHAPETRVDLHQNDMCRVAELRIRDALALVVERCHGRVIGFFCRQHVPMPVNRHSGQVDDMFGIRAGHVNLTGPKIQHRVVRGIAQLEDLCPQCGPGEACGISGHVCLA